MAEKETKENRTYKNSMFVDLFFEDESAEKNDIALYNALHEEPLPEGTAIQKIRIENVLYMQFKNDISFGVDGKVLVFGEHQASVNRNMPLRSLMYIGRAYEKLVPVRDRYRKNPVILPTPEFYTFYNGLDSWALEETLMLSDAYRCRQEEPMLELKVKVININPDKHHKLLEKCPVLKEYGQFVDTVRKYREEGEPEACRHAIEECIRRGILSDYLKKKGSEVLNMLIAEYDYDMDIEVQREEAFAEGKARGKAAGLLEGEARGKAAGLLEGEARGKVQGEAKLIALIRKKAEKGMNAADIAEILELSEDYVIQVFPMLEEMTDLEISEKFLK